MLELHTHHPTHGLGALLAADGCEVQVRTKRPRHLLTGTGIPRAVRIG